MEPGTCVQMYRFYRFIDFFLDIKVIVSVCSENPNCFFYQQSFVEATVFYSLLYIYHLYYTEKIQFSKLPSLGLILLLLEQLYSRCMASGKCQAYFVLRTYHA